MDPTLKFIIFAFVGAAALIGGRSLRTRNIVSENISRGVHLYTVILLWSPVSLIAFWGLTINGQLLTIMAIQPFIMVGAWLLAVLICRALRMRHREAGVVILCGALSNQGFTLGAYLCYVLLDPGRLAMGYAVAYVTSMQVFMVLIFFPIARHYELTYQAEDDAAAMVKRPSLPRLIIGSFFDIRAAPLYAAIGGACLSLFGPAYPQWIIDNPFVLDIAFFVGAVGSYTGIGLRLRLGDSFQYLQHHAVLVVLKFIAMPLMTVGVLWTMSRFVHPIDPLPATVVILSSFTPSAINSVIISNLFHLNARLASVLWLWNTIIYGVVVLPIIILLVK